MSINDKIRNLEKDNFLIKIPLNRAVFLNPSMLKSKNQLYTNIANSGGFDSPQIETTQATKDEPDKKEDDKPDEKTEDKPDEKTDDKLDEKTDDKPDDNKNISDSDREYAKIIKDMVSMPKNKRTTIEGFSRAVSHGNDETTIYKSKPGKDKTILWGVNGDESDKDRLQRAEQKYKDIRNIKGYKDAKIIMGGSGFGNVIGLEILKKYDDKNIVFVGFDAIKHPDYNKDDRYFNTVKKIGKQSLDQIFKNMGHPSTWSKEEFVFYRNQLKSVSKPDQKTIDKFNKEYNMGRYDPSNIIKIHEYLKTQDLDEKTKNDYLAKILTTPDLFNSILNQVEEKETLREHHEIDKKAPGQPDEIKYSLQAAAADEAYKDIDKRKLKGYTVDKDLTTDETTVYISNLDKSNVDELKKIIIGFRGTQTTLGVPSVFDAISDVGLFLKKGVPGFTEKLYGKYSPSEYRQRAARELYQKIKSKYLYNSVHLSGHSLGGSLVKHVLADNPHDKRLVGYGFNAAPDDSFYKRRKNILNNNKYDFRYKPYITYNEEDNLHDKIGRISELEHDNLRRIKSDRSSWINPISLHSMDIFKIKNKLRDRKKHSDL
jgi:hypothetical protein